MTNPLANGRSTTADPPILQGSRLARLPKAGLDRLAGLRARADVRVMADGDHAWVGWEPTERPGNDEVLRALVPVAGVAFFVEGEEGRWHRAGRRLPEFATLPPGEVAREGLPIARALVPEPIRAEPPRADWRPARLSVVRDDRPRAASALLVSAGGLLPWAESAPTALLDGLRAARSGDRVLLIGRRLPPVVGPARFWGRRVLVPVGFRTDPELPEPRLAEAIGLEGERDDDEPGDDGPIGLIGPDGLVEVVPGEAFERLSRASARRMAGVEARGAENGGGR